MSVAAATSPEKIPSVTQLVLNIGPSLCAESYSSHRLVDERADPRIDFPRVELEYLSSVCCTQRRDSVDVAPGVIEVMPRLSIDAPDGTHHLGHEHDVVERHDSQQQLD